MQEKKKGWMAFVFFNILNSTTRRDSRGSEGNFKTIFFVWLIHIVSYYTIFGLIYQCLLHYFHTTLTINIETIGKVAFSIIVGLMGWYDWFPIYFPFTLILFFIYYLKFKRSIYKSYLASFIISIIIKYFIHIYCDYDFSLRFYNRKIEQGIDINLFWFIIPSFLISCILIKIFLNRLKN